MLTSAVNLMYSTCLVWLMQAKVKKAIDSCGRIGTAAVSLKLQLPVTSIANYNSFVQGLPLADGLQSKTVNA